MGGMKEVRKMKRKSILFLAMILMGIFVFGGCADKAEEEKEQERYKVSILIPGKHIDGGFMEAAFRGYTQVREKLPVDVDYISEVSATSDVKVLTDAMRALAEKGPDMIIGHGGQCNVPAQTIAKEFPDIRFVVIQGNVKGDNLSSYVVLQEESAWLAGALAGLTTKSDVVGHISGAWPNPGLIGRAAFYDGLMYTNPDAKFLTWFTGNLDDKEINRAAAEAEIKYGADVIYTMLNSGRAGVIDQIKSTNGAVRHIGNVSDWTKVDKSFIGSAVADSSVAIFNAVKDLVDGKWKANEVLSIGLEEESVVRLAMASDVPKDIQDKIKDLAAKLEKGEITIKTTYAGQEFYPATGAFVDQSFKETLKK